MLFEQIYGQGAGHRYTEDEMKRMRVERWGADAQGPRNLFDEDYSEKFNTTLTADEETQYQAWAKEKGREKDVYDYDLRGAWKELQSGEMSEDARGHLGDKYKKPNHPTFSAESIYSGQDGIDGGVWSQNAEGKTVYTPGRKLSSVEADRLKRYFARTEPDVVLDLTDRRLDEKPLPGITQPLGVFDGMGNAWKGLPASVLQAASSAITLGKNTLADVLANVGNDETRRWWRSQRAIMDINARDIREYNKAHFEVDAETMGTATQIVHGLFKTLPKAVAYSTGLGMAGGALAFGADVGIDETNRLMDEGVDRDTAVNAGMTSFALNAIGMRLPPVLGATRLASTAYGAGVNVGTNIIESEGIKFILQHENYDELAKQYDLDAVNLAVSGIMGGAFGSVFWRSPAQIRADKYRAEGQKLYENYRDKIFNKGQSQFTFQEASVQAELNARATISLAQTLGVEPDKVLDLAPKIVWTKDGATLSGGELHMPVTQGREWHMGPQTIGRESEAVNVVHMEAAPETGRAAAIDTLATKLSNGVKNGDSGWVLTGSRGDAKKTLPPFKFAEKNAGLYDAIVQKFEQIVSDAKLIESHADIQHKNPDVRGIHKFATAASYNGKNYRVQLIVRDYLPSAGEERLATHSIDAVEVEEIGSTGGEGVIAPRAPAATTNVPPGATQSPGAGVPTAWSSVDTVSLSDLLKGFVREDKRGAFDPIDDSYRTEGAAYHEAQEYKQIIGQHGAQKGEAEAAIDDPLVAVHHIDAENLLKANELGGLAVPSIGITKANLGYSGFGDITLIGTKGLIDPTTGTPVYSADAYTNTFPEFEWGKSVDKAKAEALRREYRQAETSFRGGMDNTMRSLIDSPDRDDFMRRFRSSVVSQKMFLEEKGVKVEPVYEQPYAGTPLEKLLLPMVQKIDADGSLDAVSRMQALHAAYVQAIDALGDKATRIQKRQAENVRAGGQLASFYLSNLLGNIKKIGKGPSKATVDPYATEKRIREVFENNADGYDAWVAKKTAGLFGEPKIKVGHKLVPVTLENVVKAMTKRVAKNAQETMTFGPGKVRAAASKKFKSVEDIQASRDKVVDSDAAGAANKSIDAAMKDFRQAAAKFYGYQDSFAAFDDAMKSLADSAKGKPSVEKVRAALVKNGFKEPKEGFPPELLDSGVKILTDVQKGLTDYFEAKPQRAVGLNEFAGAVVPEGVSPEVMKALQDAGVEVRTYAPDTVLPGGERTNNRLQAEKELSQKLQQDRGDVLFQKQGGKEGGIRGAFSPSENTIKLTPNANLSTFSHEHSHWYLTNLLAHAGDENLSAEAKGDIAAILHAFGLKSVDEWNALSFEEKARRQEQYAAWTEKYLAEGKIPDSCPKYLAGFFQRFGEWLRNMYRDLLGDKAGDNPAAQEIGERYKAQFGEDLPAISPEVRKVLDRMYGVERKAVSFKPKGPQKFAARVIQSQRANNDKVMAPVQNNGVPDAYMRVIQAQKAAATAMNTGEKVDVSQAMQGVPVNDQMVQQGQNSFARSFQMGDTSTIVVLQNRDRTSAVSVGQMNAIATAPDYTRLSVSRTTDSGAPIVSYGSLPDDQHQGRTEIVADSNGDKIPMTYAVVEADSVLRSNNFDGTPVAAYGTDPNQVHAIAGNGRMAGLAEAYNRGTAEQYRQDLIADAQSVGIDPAAVQGMKKPVLVRFMPPEKVTTGFIERSNSSNVMEKSALETAVQDSPRVRGNVWKYQFDEEGNPTPETLGQFLADIGEPNALGKLITADGRPTETALNRIRAAVFYEAYRDRTLTALVADDTDKQGIKRILNAMAAFAPHVINIREASNGAVDLGPVLVDVVNRIKSAKTEGLPLENILGQGDIFGDNPAVQQVLGLFVENQNSAAGIARVLQPFAEALENRLKSSGNGPQAGLFGEAENVTTDMADAMGLLREAQNRVIEEANAALREKGVTEGLREALPDVDVNAVRGTLQALADAEKPAEKLAEAVVETVAPEAAPAHEKAPEAPADVPSDATLEAEAQAAAAHQAHERELFADNPDRTQVESLAEVNPEQVYTWMDDDGQVKTMTAKELLESDAKIDAEADTDMAGMATAAMCIIRNQGITE